MSKNKNSFGEKYKKFSVKSQYFEDLEIDKYMKKIYEICTPSYPEDYKLNKIRNYNHKIYTSVDISKLSKLPEELKKEADKIVNAIKQIKQKNLLKEELEEAIQHQEILKEVNKDLKKLNYLVEVTLRNLIKVNDKNLSKINLDEIHCKHKQKIVDAYNEVLMLAAGDSLNDYDDLFVQLKRKEKIKKLYGLVLKYDEEWLDKNNQKKLDELNSTIEERIYYYKDKITYLKDLIMENSKYQNKLISFIYYFDGIITYNKRNLDEVNKLSSTLKVYNTLDMKISKLENLFVQEREMKIKEENFAKQKVGKTNLENSVRYIKNYYNKKLTKKEKTTIEEILNNIDELDIIELKNKLYPLVNKIWENSITSIYDYNINKDYSFIVSKTPFKEEIFETILITKKMIKKVNEYDDYEIGFICGYDDNILNITENNKISQIIYDDLSNLKTPIQLEQEFVNFKVCNRLALNGYKTDIIGVYYIDTGDLKKYEKAVELANSYKLPLIQILK